MRIAVLGSGAREHAITWILEADGHDLWILPGNSGTVQLGTNVPIDPEDVDAVVAFARSQKIDLVVVGSEGPLAKGVVDRLPRLAFGPTQAAARIETSKSFALDVMSKASIPCPYSWVFANPQAVCTFVKSYGKPVVIKADGLAKGKGVWVCPTPEEAVQAAALCAELYPGPIVVQELLLGTEVSVFGFTDGYNLSELVAACDKKRRDDGDTGPNTGGMGSSTWPEFWTEELASWVAEYVMKPAIREMARRGTPYVGVLYAGLMLTQDGPKVLEFNCRLGDPEAQVILPRFKGDLAKVMLSCIRGTLSSEMVEWDETLFVVGVVVASSDYPEASVVDNEVEVSGLGKDDDDTFILHGATMLSEDGTRILLKPKAGRILTVVGLGSSLPEAREKAYTRVGRIRIPGSRFRRDV